MCHVTSCYFDYVELRDGGSMNAGLLGRFCGSTRPPTVTSTGQAMFVRFRTDSSVTRTGFKATVSFGRFYNVVRHNLYKCSAVADMGDRLATMDMGRKYGFPL